ncbi:MAG TPA: SGNH/GDSL hydrolase family protein [Polyangiaceae bacterium]|nr:SGNH/GDSL hydrolase family protein [Polyangiaceae bacterium]
MKKILILSSIALLALAFPTACSSDDDDDNPSSGGSSSVGGGGAGGGTAVGGTTAKTTTASTGGKSTTGGAASTVGGASGGKSGTAGTAGAAAGNAGTAGTAGTDSGANKKWIGTWQTSLQITETNNLPEGGTVDNTGITNSTIRQIVRISVGGSRFRLKLSNEHGSAPVVMESIHIAKSAGGGAIDVATDKALTVAGQAAVTIPKEGAVLTDAFDFDVAPLSNLAISIKFGTQTKEVTGHPGSRTTSYLKRDGNFVSDATLADTSIKPVHWYFISAIDVLAPETAAAVAVLGDSLTDGRGSTNDGNDRWTDILANRLQANAATKFVGVLNHGIGGNNILTGGLGPTAKVRFDHDILNATGVKWMIVLHGVNDIGGSTTDISGDLIAAYQEFVTKARQKGIKAYGSPILPFGGSTTTAGTQKYDTPEHQLIRDKVNAWIRTPGNFDAVIDLDAAVRDPAVVAPDPAKLFKDYAEPLWVGVDYLHLNAAGYKKMGDSVDLALFQ